MKGYLYILKTRNNRHYIGSTCDMERRLTEHSSGKTVSLKNLLPLTLVFTQEYPDISSAKRAELWLKKCKSRTLVDRIVKRGTITKNF